MNKKQKKLLDACGYEYIEDLGCFKQDERVSRIFMAYNIKLKRFVLAITKTELMSEEELITFNDEYSKKYILVSTLNSMGDSNE